MEIKLNQGKIIEAPGLHCERCDRPIERWAVRMNFLGGKTFCIFCTKRSLRAARQQMQEDLEQIEKLETV